MLSACYVQKLFMAKINQSHSIKPIKIKDHILSPQLPHSIAADFLHKYLFKIMIEHTLNYRYSKPVVSETVRE